MYTCDDDRCAMKVNGMKAVFHMPAALIPKFDKTTGEEKVQPLPPGDPRFVFPVDEYPGCPTNWMHGSAKASSYWLPVRPGCGMWLDMNHAYTHSHHVACVVSIQGVNPITGQQTKTLRLEQYRENCPVHGTAFGQDRFCEQCGYKWDAQNYICSNATPRGLFWIDGFRDADGIVRQYVFTKETCKGVAAQIAGDDRVFAVGIAFYLSKKPKAVAPLAPELTPPSDAEDSAKGIGVLKGFPSSNTISPSVKITGKDLSYTEIAKGGLAKDSHKGDIATFKRISIPLNKSSGGPAGSSWANNKSETYPNLSNPYGAPAMNMSDSAIPSQIKLHDSNDFLSLKTEVMAKNPALLGVPAGDTTMDFDPVECQKTASPSEVGNDLREMSPEEIEQEMEKLEITAGARIRQQIYTDPEDLSFWEDEPAGFIYVNYCDLATAEKIMAAGKKERAGSFLASVAGM